MARERKGAVDFWRGFVLVTIFVNHIPGNVWEHLTYRNVGFSDGAEAFVFISGLTVALAFYPKVPTGNLAGVAWRCLARAFHLYRVHLVLTFSAIALFAAVNVLTDFSDVIEPHGRGAVFHDTPRGVTGILILGHQLGYFNILPLYVVLMMWAPVLLLLVRANVALALTASIALYVMTRTTGWALPSWPEPGSWYFNPFAWQLLFTIGVVAGVWWRSEKLPYIPVAFGASVLMVVASALVVTDAFGLVPGYWEVVRHHFDFDKSNLGVARLLHFLALAYLVSQIPLGTALSRTAVGAELSRLGRNGLAVFAVGSFLCALGEVIMTLSEVKYSASPALVGMIFTALGVVALSLLARYLEWDRKVTGRWPGERLLRRFVLPSRL